MTLSRIIALQECVWEADSDTRRPWTLDDMMTLTLTRHVWVNLHINLQNIHRLTQIAAGNECTDS